jgi:hypothetical protein
MGMRHIIMWPVRLYNIFPHYLTNGTIVGGGGGITEHKMCVLIFSTTFVWKISHSKKNWARCDQKCVLVFMCSKCPLFLSDLNETWIFPTVFSKLTRIPTFMKIRPVGAGLFRADGRTDTTTLTAGFRNFANAPKTVKKYISYSLLHCVVTVVTRSPAVRIRVLSPMADCMAARLVNGFNKMLSFQFQPQTVFMPSTVFLPV